jgi:hypothetical protein
MENYKNVLKFIFLFLCCNFQVSQTQVKENKTRKSSNTGNYYKRQLVFHTFMEKPMLMPFLVCYTQCEDDFVRIEMNYIEKLGRLSEIKDNPFYIMIWKQD